MIPASNLINVFHIPKTGELISLKLGGNRLIYFTRFRGGELEFGLAEHRRPMLKGGGGYGYPNTQYHYARLSIGEITLEKDLEASVTNKAVRDLTDLSNILAEAYMGGHTVIVYRKVFVRQSGESVNPTQNNVLNVSYHGHILHYHVDDAQTDREGDVVRLTVVVQPEMVDVEGLKLNLAIGK